MNLYKKLYHTGILAFSVLLVLSVLFYKERSILLDNSFFLFEMLRLDEATVQRNRFIAGIPQMLPLLASRLSLSLKWVLVAYSASYVLYQFACYLVTGSLLKNYRLALSLLFVNTLLITHVFFWNLSELLLGIGLIFPLLALIAESEQKKPLVLLRLLQATGIFLIAFSHPLIVFPFLFIIVFFWLSKNSGISKKELAITCMIFLLLYSFKTLFLTDAYESESIDTAKNIKTLFTDIFTVYSNNHFLENWLHIYYWLPVTLLLTSVVYIKNKLWWKLSLLLIGFTGYTLLVNFSYPTYKTHEFYMENMYMVLGVIMVLPLVFDVFPMMNKKLVIAICLLIVCSSFYRINKTHHFYENRLSWYRGYLDKNGDEKLIVSYNGKPEGTILLPWSSPYEFWLLSTLERGRSASIIIHENIDEIGWAYDNYRAFVGRWGVYPYKDLNPDYFIFTDTQRHYSVYKEGR